MEKKIAAGTGDSFDAKVAEMIQAQALLRGVKYDILPAASTAKWGRAFSGPVQVRPTSQKSLTE
jgi:hypothetical protein